MTVQVPSSVQGRCPAGCESASDHEGLIDELRLRPHQVPSPGVWRLNVSLQEEPWLEA